MAMVRRGLAVCALIFTAMLGLGVRADTPVEVSRGVAWLQAQLNADGSLSGEGPSAATMVQARAETAISLAALLDPSAVPQALSDSLQLVPGEPSEHLARKLIALSTLRKDTSALAAELAGRQAIDGGFAPQSGLASTVLDTVWAYAALARTPSFNGAATARAYLLGQMQSDGGLPGGSLVQREQNSALGILALQFASTDLASLTATRQLAQWLQSKQQTDGSWSSSDYVTALALYAVSATGADSAMRANARANLVSHQMADGSWNGDPFLTAVVLRAIAIDPTATPSASSIAGLAIDPSTGTPLSGVQVTLSGTANNVATTGADGRFSFSALAAGGYTVQLAKTGFASASRSVTLGYGQNSDLGTIAMGQSSTAGIVKGRVTSASNGLPLAGASVSLAGAMTATVRTDAQGAFEVDNAVPGSVTITVSMTGYVDASGTGNVTAGQTLVFSPTLYDQGSTTVPTTGRLIGRVVSAGTGVALAGVSIDLNGVSAGVTGSDGRFDLTLAPQSYVMRLAPSGYDAVAGNFLMSAGALVDAGTIALSPQRTTTTISGRVSDQSSGQAIGGATVGLVGGTSVTTAADGSYTLANLTGTVFDIRVAANGYLTQTWQLQVDRPSELAQDFAIAPQPTSTIDLSNLTVTPSSAGAHAAIGMTATVTNNGTASQDVVLALQVLGQDGSVVATGSAFTTDGVNLLGTFGVAAGEQRPVLFKWNSGQFAPGAYRLSALAIEAGTISRDNPNGRVLASRSAPLTITATSQFIGSVTADPPVLRANTGTTVKLSAVIQNSGNVDLPAQSYHLDVIDDKTSALITSSDVSADALTTNQIANVSFANWVPTSGGNFRLVVTVPGATDEGQLNGKVYVGDAATASYTLNKSVVPAGNQQVHATLLVTGQDSATGTISDPLAGPIKTAIQKGVTYNDLHASNWVLSNKCLGCHVVTQAIVGGELTRRLTTYNTTQRDTLLNSLATYLQSNGAVYASHPEYAGAQTTLGLWALNSMHHKDEVAMTLTAAADFILGRQESAGSWYTDYAAGWWDARPANTAFNLKSLTEVIDTLKRVPNPTKYTSTAWKSGSGLNGTYYLARTATDQVLVSNYLAGTVTAVNPDGSVQTLMTGLTHPGGMVTTSDGSLYVVNATEVRRRASDGTVSNFAAIAGADAITQGPDGNFYVSKYSASTIYRVSPAGAVTTYLSGSPLSGPVGMSFDADGNLVVVNYAATNIVRFRPDKSYEVLVTWTNGNPRSVVPFGTGWLVGTTTGVYRFDGDWLGERESFVRSDGLVVLSDNTIVTGDGGTTVYKLTPSSIDGGSKIAAYTNAISRATTWLLNDANVNTSSNLELAHRLIGLGSAKNFYAGTPTADTLAAKMSQVATLLRSRQRSDGGWGRWNGWGSDSMVTAQVGFALDYLQPSATDPVVQNAIKYLLSRQQADGSWYSENGILSTHVAATTWVEIWLPIALDRIGGIDANLTLRFATNVAMANPTLAPTATVVNPDSTTTYTWQLTGVTSASRSIQFDLNLADMQLGESRPASADAFLTFRNSFTGDSVNAPIQVPAVAASAFLGLGVGTDRTEYGPNVPVAISGQVGNLGVASSSGSVEYNILALDGTPVASLGRVSFADVAPSATTVVPDSWNTGSTYAGQYLVQAKLYDSANRYVATAVSAFAIRASDSAGGVTINGTLKTDKASYAPTELVRLSDLVSNVAPNQNASGLQVTTSIVNPDGSTRWTLTSPAMELPAGGVRSLAYSVPLGNAPAGTYAARLEVRDAQGTTVATDAKSFVVQSSSLTGAGLAGTLQATPKQVPLGDVAQISFGATNNGNDTLTDLPLTVNIVDPVAQQVVAQFSYSNTIAPSATFASSANWTANGTVGNTYVAVLSATVGGKSLVLAQDNLTVIEPPVRLSLAPSVQRSNRLLVLVSCSPGADAQGHTAAEDPTCVASRAQWLAAFLAAQGIQYHISTTLDDFVSEFQCGRYNAYWLSGGTQKLGAGVVKEVREAVRRGAGLLIDGTHDERNGLLDEVPGVAYRGKLPQSGYGVELTGPAFNAASLTSSGSALKYDVLTGSTQGDFVGQSGQSAVVTSGFGNGHAAMFAFDLVGSLQAGGWDQVFASALSAVSPAQLASYTGGAWIPLSLSVTNQASQAAVVVVSAQLPVGVSLEGVPVDATLDASGNPVWQFTLGSGETRQVQLSVRSGYSSGTISVPFQVSTIRNGVTRLYDSVNATFSVQAADAMGAGVVQGVQALAPTTAPQRNARDRAAAGVQAGLLSLSQANYADAVSQFLSAADNLETITTAPVADVLLGVARLVAEAEAHQCNSLPVCTTTAPRLVSDGYFSTFAPNEGVEARGGTWGDTDWEWGLGSDTATTGAFIPAQFVWTSGKQYSWSLSYDGAGNGTLSVLDGATTILSSTFQGSANGKLRTGNAVQIAVRATATAGLSKVDASVTKLQGQWVAGAQSTRGDGSYSEGQLTYLLPSTGGALSASGTVRLTFSDLTPPVGTALRFTVNAGNSVCRAQ